MSRPHRLLGLQYDCITCGTPVRREDDQCEECFIREEFGGDANAFEDAMDDFEEKRRRNLQERNEY